MDDIIKNNDLFYISGLNDNNKIDYKKFYCTEMCGIDFNFNDISGLCLKKNDKQKTIDININSVDNKCLIKNNVENSILYRGSPTDTSKVKYNLSNISIKAPSIHTFDIDNPEFCEVILDFKTDGDNPLHLFICILANGSQTKQTDITYSLFEEIGRYMLIMNKNKTDYINCKNIESFNVIDFFPNVTQKYIPYITNNKGDNTISTSNNSNANSFFAVLVLPDLIKIPASFQFIFKQTFYTSNDGRLDPNNEFINLLNRKPTLRKNINYYFYENFNKKWNDGNVKANTNIIPEETLETYRKLLFPTNQSNQKEKENKEKEINIEDNNNNKDNSPEKTEEKKQIATWKIILIIIFIIILIGIIIYLFYKYNLFEKIKNVIDKSKTIIATATPLVNKFKMNLKVDTSIPSPSETTSSISMNKETLKKQIIPNKQNINVNVPQVEQENLSVEINKLKNNIQNNKQKLKENINKLNVEIIKNIKEIEKKESTNISSL
jgi:type VII secretion protein EssA